MPQQLCVWLSLLLHFHFGWPSWKKIISSSGIDILYIVHRCYNLLSNDKLLSKLVDEWLRGITWALNLLNCDVMMMMMGCYTNGIQEKHLHILLLSIVFLLFKADVFMHNINTYFSSSRIQHALLLIISDITRSVVEESSKEIAKIAHNTFDRIACHSLLLVSKPNWQPSQLLKILRTPNRAHKHIPLASELKRGKEARGKQTTFWRLHLLLLLMF